MLPITKATRTANTTACSTRIPKYIGIHYTAGVTSKTGSAKNVATYFANPNAKASADFIVDDGTIVQYNGNIANRYCWAVGGGKQSSYGGNFYQKCTNANSISIEMCSYNITGKVTQANDKNWRFTDAVVNNTVDLVKYLMQLYNIPASNVIRHFDVTGKYCPSSIGWIPTNGTEDAWKAFKARLTNTSATTSKTSTINTQQTTATNTAGSTAEFKVRVSTANLRIRKSPSLSGAFVKYCPTGVYTIVETKKADGYTWGKLKSGLGYIALEYTQRC